MKEEFNHEEKTVRSIVYNAVVLVVGLIMIYPLLWMVMSSFKDTNTIFTTATQLIPETFTVG